MSDKIYPAIYEFEDGCKYLHADSKVYFCYTLKCWQRSKAADEHEYDKNITREYLARTCGKVESLAHAKFIIELCKGNGIEAGDSYKYKKYFSVEGDELYFWHTVESVPSACDKEITIPMPPSENKLQGAEVSNKQAISGLEGLAKLASRTAKTAKGSEWPQVGDEIVTIKCRANEEDLIKEGLIGTILTEEFKGEFCVKLEIGLEIMDRSQFKKPKTRQQKLRDELMECNKPKLDTLQAEDLATWLLDNYEINRKPQ